MTASQETLASQTAHLLSALSPEAALECEVGQLRPVFVQY